MCQGAGGVAWTGTSLAVVRQESNHNGFVLMDTTGGEISKGYLNQDWPSEFDGLDGIAFLSEGSYIGAKSGKLHTANTSGSSLEFSQGTTFDITGVTQIKALTSVTAVSYTHLRAHET